MPKWIRRFFGRPEYSDGPPGTRLPDGRISYRFSLDFWRNWYEDNGHKFDELNNFGVPGVRFDSMMGIGLLRAKGVSNLAERFLTRCLSKCERIVSDIKLNAADSISAPDVETVFRTRAFSAAALSHLGWAECFLAASQASEQSAHYFGSFNEGWYDDCDLHILAAIRESLLGGDCGRAHFLLSRYPCPNLQTEYSLLRRLADESAPIFDRKLQREFDEYFDWARSLFEGHSIRITDDYSVTIQAEEVGFELSGLRDKYFTSHDGLLSWPRAIEQWAF